MKKIFVFIVAFVFILPSVLCQNLRQLWTSPPEESKSWVYWYWMQGAVSKEGITADIEAMKDVGIAGAYLMPIKGVPEQPFVTPIVEQLSPLWWEMVEFAFREADRVGIKMGFHICDGFALAGGPWITPELSMQKVVWEKINIQGGKTINQVLPQPESYKGYYKDIAVFAYPTPQGEGVSTETVKPKVTTNVADIDPQFLADKNSDGTFRSESPCWIQYAFDKPFICRTVQVQASSRNFQGQRLTIEASDDGVNFRKIVQLEPPRQGWQNDDFPMTNSIPTTTARYFRFLYDKWGTEPGSEDLDAAKWKQSLKIKGIWLSSEARIHQYEGKSAQAWRLSPRTTDTQLTNDLCVDPTKVINISQYVDKEGNTNWEAPKGNWTILRMGHTSTGHTNATGGKGAGLECDKFNPEAIRLQFNSWFGKAVEVAGKDLASRVLKVFHVDSWECGSQNWSSNFRDEFKERRGYDLYPYLPVMAGIPIASADNSEKILYDIRQTISELVVDKFYAILKEEANAKGCQFSAECVSPTMMSDGMMHYKNTDIPMGEYWLQSPTHDKPNDILDAISGGHIYEKNIIQAEAFTQLRTMFDEHPAMLKALQDRHYALGINRLSYHVNVLNPWLDRQPGMTLDGIGLYFQRDQTWWKLGRAWVEYAQRCQALLQFGRPVVDIAVFTGEELPRRAILPDRLVPFLPGIFGKEKVEEEKIRLANVGEPSRQMPVGVHHSSNITGLEDWINPLKGYQYDSFNPDVLLNAAKVVDGRIVLANGMSYAALVIPGKHPMQPNPELMSEQVMNKLIEFALQGASLFMEKDLSLEILKRIDNDGKLHQWQKVSKITKLPVTDETFPGITPDFMVKDWYSGEYAKDIAYTHRQGNGVDIYFVSNQANRGRRLNVSLRVSGKIAEIWYPETGKVHNASSRGFMDSGYRTNLPIRLDAYQSLFIVLQKPANNKTEDDKEVLGRVNGYALKKPWTVHFDPARRGLAEPIVLDELTDWSTHTNDSIRYYSGTAIYKNTINLDVKEKETFSMIFDDICNMAEVKINNISCGILWTKPYTIDITDAVKNGENTIEIEVANTWANRIMGDEDFGAEKDDSKKIWTNARYRLPKKELVKSGLIGDVIIQKWTPYE